MTPEERFFEALDEDYSDLATEYEEDVLEAYWDNLGTLDNFERDYLGMFHGHSEESAVGQWKYDEYSYEADRLPEPFRRYVDWDSMGNDALQGGEVWIVYVSRGEYAIFLNN